LKNVALRNRVKNRVKKSIENAQQEEALKELLKAIGANGGKAPYGEVKKIVKAYNANGFKAVTRQNLYYRLSLLNSSSNRENDSQLVGATIVTGVNMEGVLSGLTEECIMVETDAVTTYSSSTNTTTINIGGHKKGSTKQKKQEDKQKVAEVTSTCATLFIKKLKNYIMLQMEP
jgi:hypothetical protein